MTIPNEPSFLARLITRLRAFGRPKPKAFSHARSSKRFPVQLPLKVRYGPAMSIEATGETRDVSVGGIFFVTPDAIPTGTDIELLLPVPPPLAKEGKMWMFCTARVVRAQKSASGSTGIGALISGYKVAAEA